MVSRADQCVTQQPKNKTHLLAFEVQVQLPLQALARVHMVPVVPEGGQLLILLNSAVHNVTHPLLLPLQSLHPPHHCQLVSDVELGCGMDCLLFLSL